MIDKFLEELRNSADIQYKIFTEGSCFRLYIILKLVFPEAVAYWSDIDNHCITKLDGEFYDIGGVMCKNYVEDNCYYEIPSKQLRGYSLLKWVKKDPQSIKVEKYKSK